MDLDSQRINVASWVVWGFELVPVLRCRGTIRSGSEALWCNGPVRETVYQGHVSVFVDSTGIEVHGK